MKKRPLQEKEKLVGFGKYKDKQLKWVAQNDLEFFKEIKKLYYYSKFSESKKAIYDKIANLHFKTGTKVGDETFKIKVDEVVSLLKQRKTNEEIQKYLKSIEDDGMLIKEIIMHARTIIRREFNVEKEFLLDIHLIRYEELYDKSINMDLSHIQPGYRNAVKSENYLTAMETLFQKERLLGIHSKKFKERSNFNKINNNTTLDFKLDNLSFDEKIELFNLLNKAKPIEKINYQSIGDPNVIVENKLELIEGIIDAPISKSKETNIIGEEDAKVVKDSGKNLVEVQQVINKSIHDKVKEMYDKKFNK